MTKKLRIGLLFGGRSAEHEISLVSARSIYQNLDAKKYSVVLIGIGQDGRWYLQNDARQLRSSGCKSLKRLAPGKRELLVNPAPHRAGSLVGEGKAKALDVIFPVLHGPFGEDGTVQGMLDLANVPYVGSGVLGSAVSMDKAMAKQVLTAAGIPQARYRAFAEHEMTPGLPAELVDELGLPVFVKPANMGSSVGVSKAATLDALREAIGHALSYDEMIVVEEAITGREIEVAVLGTTDPEASVPGEIVPGEEFYSYEDKYVTDAAQLLIPAPLPDAASEDVRRLAVDTFRALRCDGLARVDFFYEMDDDGHGRGFLCNEVNTMPGFTPISMYPKLWIHSGLSYSELIDRLVDLALERHARRRRNTKR